MLFLSANSKYEADLDTMLELDGSTASAELELEDVITSVNAHVLHVYYVPNGEDPLRSGSIATSFSVAYDVATNSPPRAVPSLIELNYAGADAAVKAYAIAPPSNPDDSNIRIRCAQSAPCTIYLACDGADGAGYFGKMADMIGPRMVETVTAMELAEIVGAEDGDFSAGCPAK